MTEANSSKSQEDYEDDFEKDLDWLIGEEGQSEQGSDYGDIDAEIDKELEKEETPGEGIGNEDRDKKPDHVEDHEERWPSPMEPLGYDTDKESTSLPAESPSEMYEQTDEEQMYILGKIEQANKELQEQETPDMTRQRRLHFKDTLVDLVVPPLLPDSNSDDTDEEKESALIQKELLQKMNERKERLAREAEQRKREEEELKKQENEQAFKSWLIRKREQIFEERKIHRAKEIERMNAKRDVYDPEEAYRSWLKKKKEQVQRERQVLELRKHEEECNCLMHSRQECDHAFNLWLKRKQDEKRAQQLLALEQSRRLGLEVRRSRRMTELICSVSKNRPFQFTDDSAYRY
ncbi:coiled-coil domain-containing protein 181 isoform X4 [Xiphophorus couchianus]|uniref:coiled-coil domain-containing protein 181 isoform X4 n=1 Tax=Xiphophorus couchianus TaxID=32473 RepID=UPI001016A7F7|nr:coiled-coil domain-containing protein 181 isoform X4 [Xiphophorus couchianus]